MNRRPFASLVIQGEVWNHDSNQLATKYPGYFIPAGNGGNEPAWTKNSERFLAANERNILEQGLPLIREFEFHHYLLRVKFNAVRIEMCIYPLIAHLDINCLFFVQRTGIPFKIHYEIEGQLLGPLKKC